MSSTQKIWLALIAVAIIAVIGLFTPSVVNKVSKLAGGVTNYDEVDATALKIGGANGSRVGPVIAGIGAIVGNVPMAATSTKSFDIAVTGVVSGDTVFAQPATTSVATSTGTGQASFAIQGASASTTSGFITITVVNNGTSTTAVSNYLASSTSYLVLHPVTSIPGL